MADVMKTPGDETYARLVTPDVDVFQNSAGYLVVADVPGARREGLEVKVEDRRLIAQGPLGEATFRREFHLPRDVDTDGIQADLADGVLTVTLPKLEAARPRRIEIG